MLREIARCTTHPSHPSPDIDRVGAWRAARSTIERLGAGDISIRALEAPECRFKRRAIPSRDEYHIVEQLDARCRVRSRIAIAVTHVQLGQPHCRNTALLPEHRKVIARFRGRQALHPFVAHSLRRQVGRRRGLILGSSKGRPVDGEVEPCSETQCPQDPEPIFTKSIARQPHRAHQPALEVASPIKGITPCVGQRMVRDGVDGEVTAREVIVK